MNVNLDGVMAELKRRAERAVTAGVIVLANKVKEALSVPAPRRRVLSRRGVVYYRATTPATPGAPPRKLSGRLRSSITRQTLDTPDGPVGLVGTNVVYARRHEYGAHPFLSVTLAANLAEVTAAMGRELGR